MDTVSIFNKTVKSLLVDLKKWAPEDGAVKNVRKIYMKQKQDDENAPYNTFVEYIGNDDNKDAIQNKDTSHFTTPAIKGLVDALTEEQQSKTWEYLQSLVLLTETSQATEALSLPETFGQEMDFAAMIEKTTHLMPKLFEQMGMQVSEEEIQGAAKHIQSSNMMGIFSKIMSAGLSADSNISNP